MKFIYSLIDSFFLNQQFITWSMQADHGRYFVTTYNRSRQTWNRKQKERKEKKRRKTNHEN